MDSSPLALALSALAGIGIGLLYFGILWLTMSRMRAWKNPGFVMAFSFILRAVIMIGGFYLAADGKVERLAFALLAFFVTRLVLMKYLQPSQAQTRERKSRAK